MNGKKILSRRQAPPLVPLLALILTVAAVLTAPLAMSKYVATGAGAAGARIAKWDIQFTQNPVTGSTGYFSGTVVGTNHPFTGSNYPTQTTTRTFTITNSSEVIADVTIQLRYTQNDAIAVTSASTLDVLGQVSTSAASGLTATIGLSTSTGVTLQSGTTYRFPIGASATFTLTTKATDNTPRTPSTTSGTASYWQNCIRNYKVFFNAVQVD